MRTSRCCSTPLKRPGWTRRRSRHVPDVPLLPSRRIAALIALTGAVFILSTTLALALNAVVLALLVADAIALYRLPLPQLQRDVPPRLPLGGVVSVPVELYNPARVQRRVQWTDDPGPGLVHGAVDVIDVQLPAGA